MDTDLTKEQVSKELKFRGITEETLQKLLAYLYKRPYEEVAGFCGALRMAPTLTSSEEEYKQAKQKALQNLEG